MLLRGTISDAPGGFGAIGMESASHKEPWVTA
jgi:hypothetical protein